ncbi:hypothetical protein BGZ96_009355 [Linnemannia gamsii]|uniref:Uncharacterized protein n=1 Tax=Linnemannia gamsii TaxID=64522 RepID=A0ABQ7JWY3_9FUNG|nr:hypothetical protein BGZ96_009355 [Linnemannia gamsii]
MSKRSLPMTDADVEAENEHLQRRSSVASDGKDATFQELLAKGIFSGRPTTVERAAIAYIAQMRLVPSPEPGDFTKHIRRTHPHAIIAIARVWHQLKEYFGGDKDIDYSYLEGLTNIPDLVSAFENAPYIDTDEPLAAGEATPGTSSPQARRSFTRTRSSKSSGKSSTGSLSPAALQSMRARFNRNFDLYAGESWILPSGGSLDDLLATYIGTLTRESALHSFIIEDFAVALELVADDADKGALEAALKKRKEEALPELAKVERDYLEVFNRKPEDVKTLLRNGLSNLTPSSGMSQLPDEDFCDNVFYAMEHIYKGYAQRNLSIPNKQSESWYLGMVWGFFGLFMGVKDCLDYQPGEICLQASSWRKNKGRSLESKHIMGRKVDGVVFASASRLELCVVEAAKIDNGSTGTKALSDTMKLAKSMKDMSDLIRSKSSSDIRDELVTFGIRFSGATITIYTLRQRCGRFYQFTCVANVVLPARWLPKGTNTKGIILVVTLLMQLKAAMVEMAEKVANWTSGAVLLPDAAENGDQWASTLTTPCASPRLSPTD